MARCSITELSLPIEYSITGRSLSATASRKIWMLSASRRCRCVSLVISVVTYRQPNESGSLDHPIDLIAPLTTSTPSHRRPATVHGQHCSGHVGARLAGEEQRDVRDLINGGSAPEAALCAPRIFDPCPWPAIRPSFRCSPSPVQAHLPECRVAPIGKRVRASS